MRLDPQRNSIGLVVINVVVTLIYVYHRFCQTTTAYLCSDSDISLFFGLPVLTSDLVVHVVRYVRRNTCHLKARKESNTLACIPENQEVLLEV